MSVLAKFSIVLALLIFGYFGLYLNFRHDKRETERMLKEEEERQCTN